MLDARFVPLERWPREETRRRKSAPFRSSWSATLKLLQGELRQLGARGVVIQADFLPHMIRNDGWPRSSARPTSPRVIVSFESRKGPLSFPCDRFDFWEDNVRAIALTLERLRAVDRYGVTALDEQYRGWKALPAGDGSVAAAWQAVGTMTVEDAARLIAEHSDVEWEDIAAGDVELMRTAYRAASKVLHPDVGGNASSFARLVEARKLIETVYGGVA